MTAGEAVAPSRNTIVLFDLDGTLSPSRCRVQPEVLRMLLRLREKVTVGIVSGSDEAKVIWQLLPEEDTTISKDERRQLYDTDRRLLVDFVFAENGTMAYKDGKLIGQQSILKWLGEEKLQRLINFVLRYLSELTLPAKRGTFIEYRNGMLNFCPVGRSCSMEERKAFAAYDAKHGVRQKMVEDLRKQFDGTGLRFAIGGQISVDCFPEGWDKRYCLQFVKDFEVVHFFGDKTEAGGNDHEIFHDNRTIGHRVTEPSDTLRQIEVLFGVHGRRE